MPTGYTAKLCKGKQTFKDFALQCARAFGALIDMRDDSMDVPIPEDIKRSTYYDEALSKAITDYDKLKAMLPGEALAYGKACSQKRIKQLKGWLAEHKSARGRILKMISRVEAWPAPTKEHVPMKIFMLEQLGSTLQHDGDTAYYEKEIAKAKTLTPIEYYQADLSTAARNIDYYKEEAQKDRERNASRNAWLKALRQSLGNA